MNILKLLRRLEIWRRHFLCHLTASFAVHNCCAKCQKEGCKYRRQEKDGDHDA